MSIYSFWIITLENINGFSPNLICAMILWRSEFELLTGKFHQFLTELSTCDRSVFSFPDDNFNKCQWIFTKLGLCISIVEIWFRIAHWQISSILDTVICHNTSIF